MGRVIQGSILSATKTYECQCSWPEDCFVQYGDRGIVFTASKMEDDLKNPEELLGQVLKPTKPHYRTAFFEAFPTNPKTFIRGEGKDIVEAEASAWKQFTKYSECSGHEFERRGYESGAGFCKHCNLFKSNVFEPTTKCVVCQVPSYYSNDKQKNWYCEEHHEQNPDKIDF